MRGRCGVSGEKLLPAANSVAVMYSLTGPFKHMAFLGQPIQAGSIQSQVANLIDGDGRCMCVSEGRTGTSRHERTYVTDPCPSVLLQRL